LYSLAAACLLSKTRNMPLSNTENEVFMSLTSMTLGLVDTRFTIAASRPIAEKLSIPKECHSVQRPGPRGSRLELTYQQATVERIKETTSPRPSEYETTKIAAIAAVSIIDGPDGPRHTMAFCMSDRISIVWIFRRTVSD
jgi:hypothetical protein